MGERVRFVLASSLALVLLAFIASPARAACTGPAGTAGTILYNDAQNKLQYCDDTNWIAMGVGPQSGGGCTNPTGTKGHVLYNGDYNVPQYCNGFEWVAISSATPPGSLIPGGWVQMDSGYATGCAIKASGSLWCWGANGYGQLGDSSYTDRYEATEVNGGGSWKQVSSGFQHTCAIKSDDTLWCWGQNANGRTGLNTTAGQTLSPTQVNGGGSWKQVSAGTIHTCGIKSNDTLWCWGNNGTGRLGDTTTTQRLVPTAIATSDTWAQISAGNAHTCGIKSDNTAWCWGLDTSGQRGDAAAGYSNAPNAVSVTGSIPDTWKSIDASVDGAHTCGIGIDDTLWCWGYDNFYQLGNDTTIANSPSPQAVSVAGSIPDTWKAVATGFMSSCAIASDDTLWCFGSGWQISGGSFDRPYTPVQIQGGGTWTHVSHGVGYSNNGFICALTTNGRLSCWGHAEGNIYGELPVAATSSTPQLKDSSDWKSLESSNEGIHRCGIKSDDTLWCWGWNYYGTLGDGTTTDRTSPTQVSGGGTWKQVSIGWNHTCSIRGDDTLRCWGNNDSGQLGDNTYTTRLVPTTISGGGTWKQVAPGEQHTCGIKSDDTLWCWGNDSAGQLGSSASSGSLVPVAVSGGGTWKWVASGYLHSCGIKSDDTLWCWGENYYGQLGDNNNPNNSDVPTAVFGGGTWKRVDGAEIETCGIKSDDTLWCWGYNGYGKVGDGSLTQRNSPVTVSGGGTWKQIDGGGWFSSCGIKSDDTAWCWGAAGFGAIGDGSYQRHQTAPAQVSGGMTWKSVAVSAYNACAIASADDSLWCWGLLTPSGHPLLPQEMMDDRCTSPEGNLGDMIYNGDHSVLQFCNGASWVGIGK